MPGYTIEKLLGKGGMGAVYQGIQTNLDRPVAIKIISNDLDEADASYGERFKNEAKAMAKLSHPGIVAVHDYGMTTNGILYIVMEFVEGTDVAKMISQQKRLHTDHAMAITAHVCDALAYAHERGIIHRDIKPANIMVGYDGVVKVADFGLAKMTKSGESGLTQSGMAMGTLHYMAPEALILGASVDHRADVYAVGVMLYQMLTGKVPHGMFELPSMQVPGLDLRYDAIIAKAMREDRDIRYQSVRELRTDLDSILTQPVVKVDPEAEKVPAALPTQARPQRPEGQSYCPPRISAHVQKKSPTLLMTAVVVVSIGLLAWFWTGRSGPLPEPGAVVQTVVPTTEPKSSDNQTASSTPTVTSAPPIPTSVPLPSKDSVSPAGASKDKPFVNSLGMKFVPVPITGGPTNGQRVLFSIWETRVQDYEVFVTETKRTWSKPNVAQDAENPAVMMNWADAKAFCAWLTARDRKEGRLKNEEEYRLPSDHEWSCAVGIGAKENASLPPKDKSSKLPDVYPWGSGYPPPAGAGNYHGEETEGLGGFPVLTGYRDEYVAMSPVGRFTANEFGLFDLGGSVWEFCDDLFSPSQPERVMRGATFNNRSSRDLNSSFRIEMPLADTGSDKGFRVVLATVRRDAAPVVATPKPAPAPATDPSTNTLGMKFAPLPNSKASLCIHETRRADYAAFAAAVPAASPAWKSTSAADNHPVTNVSWEEASAFCAWLSKKENRRYRLPTDREWSIAVGIAAQESATATPFKLNGAVAGVYPWSKSKTATVKAGNYAGAGDVYEQTAPVMSFPANDRGFHDLGGNVWEYCADHFNPGATTRVLRGASWMDSDPAAQLSSCRDPVDPSARSAFVGFRVVLEESAINNTHPVPPPSSTTAPLRPSSMLRADKVKYLNKAGIVVDRFAWKGKQAAVLTVSAGLDAAVMSRLIDDYDRVYDYYREITRREPRKTTDVGQLAITAEDDTSSSGGVSTNGMSTVVGLAKIWAVSSSFAALYQSFATQGEHSVTWFREFGLNTWYYAPQLSPSGIGYMDFFPSGYCVLMQTMAARKLALKIPMRRGREPSWDRALSALLDSYIADTNSNYANTLAVGKAPDNSSSFEAPELFAAFCLRLCDDHGGDAFLTKLWQEVGKAQPAKTAQDCIDTFILSACAAADKDLSPLFTTQWRWPMSVAAQAKAAKRWKKP